MEDLRDREQGRREWLEDIGGEKVWPFLNEVLVARRERNLRREGAEMDKLARAPSMTAIDVPLAGVDPPYGKPIQMDVLRRLDTAYGMEPGDYRIYETPDPPSTIVRIRMRERRRSEIVGFMRDLTRHCREAEESARLSSDGVPQQAQYAGFGGRVMGRRGVAGDVEGGLSPIAPPDAVAIALAAWAAALVLQLPVMHPAGWPGRRDGDLLLPAQCDARTRNGRLALDEVDEVLRGRWGEESWRRLIGPRPESAMKVASGEAEEADRAWRVVGFDGPEDPERAWMEGRAREIAQGYTGRTPGPEYPDPPPAPDDPAYLARVGLGSVNTLASVDTYESTSIAALTAAAEHGLAGGQDARMVAMAREIDAAPLHHEDALDLRLGLERLAHIPEDPCRAARVRRHMGDREE